MKQPTDYIATWFYKESAEEASFYPQMGQKGDSSLVHSVYMQIQVPFFKTFRHYNPEAHLLFFTNLSESGLPRFLTRLFETLQVKVITLPYTCRPPKEWYAAWQNQFYLYDILKHMESIMEPEDTLLVTDADCLCRSSLSPLFEEVRSGGCALYEFITDRKYKINGITLPEMDSFYEACYGMKPRQPMAYYGGEFICLRGDVVNRINQAYADLWKFNILQKDTGKPKLNEEAHILSILAERLGLRNNLANRYVKRMWTSPQFNNVVPGDEKLSVWHLPYEKKRGLYRLYKIFSECPDIIGQDENAFWEKAGRLTGVPQITLTKRLRDIWTEFILKLK